MDVRVSRLEPGSTLMEVSGDVDLSTAEVLREALVDVLGTIVPGAGLVIDMSNVALLDSIGLGVLVGAHRRAAAARASVKVVASPTVRRSLHLSGLDQLLEVTDTDGA